MNETERLARYRTIDVARAIANGARTVEALHERLPDITDRQIRTCCSYLKRHAYIERIDGKHARAVYALTTNVDNIIEQIAPKVHAEVEFSLLEKCMGVPAGVTQVMGGNFPCRIVEKMGHAEMGRPKTAYREARG